MQRRRIIIGLLGSVLVSPFGVSRLITRILAEEAPQARLLGDWYTKIVIADETAGYMLMTFLPNGRFVQRWLKGTDPHVPLDHDGNIDYYGDYEFDGSKLRLKPTSWKAWSWDTTRRNTATPATGYIGVTYTFVVQFEGEQMRFQDQLWTRGTP